MIYHNWQHRWWIRGESEPQAQGNQPWIAVSWMPSATTVETAHMRFTLRESLGCMLVVALVIGWIIDHRQQSQEISRLKEEVGQLQVDTLHATYDHMSETVDKMMRGYVKLPSATVNPQSTNPHSEKHAP